MKRFKRLMMVGVLALCGCSQIEIVSVEHDDINDRFNVKVKNLEANDTSARIYITGNTTGNNVPWGIAKESERFDIGASATKVVHVSTESGFSRVHDWALCIDAGVHSTAKICDLDGGVLGSVLACSPLADAGKSCP